MKIGSRKVNKIPAPKPVQHGSPLGQTLMGRRARYIPVTMPVRIPLS